MSGIERRLVEILPGFAVPEGGTFSADNYRGFAIECDVELVNGHYEAQQFNIRRLPGGPPITTEALRDMAIQLLVGTALTTALHKVTRTDEGAMQVNFDDDWHTADEFTGFGLLIANEARELGQAGPVPETIAAVAKVYLLANALGASPTKAVRETFDISQSTAGAWVGRARSAGLLGSVVSGSDR